MLLTHNAAFTWLATTTARWTSDTSICNDNNDDDDDRPISQRPPHTSDLALWRDKTLSSIIIKQLSSSSSSLSSYQSLLNCYYYQWCSHLNGVRCVCTLTRRSDIFVKWAISRALIVIQTNPAHSVHITITSPLSRTLNHGALWHIDSLRLRNILTYLLTYLLYFLLTYWRQWPAAIQSSYRRLIWWRFFDS